MSREMSLFFEPMSFSRSLAHLCLQLFRQSKKTPFVYDVIMSMLKTGFWLTVCQNDCLYSALQPGHSRPQVVELDLFCAVLSMNLWLQDETTSESKSKLTLLLFHDTIESHLDWPQKAELLMLNMNPLRWAEMDFSTRCGHFSMIRLSKETMNYGVFQLVTVWRSTLTLPVGSLV